MSKKKDTPAKTQKAKKKNKKQAAPENAEPKKPLWKRLIKWTLITLVLVFILLTVLSRMGGSSDVLKTAVEDFLTDASPYTARIARFNEMQFFPTIVLDVEGLEFRGGEGGQGETAIHVSKFRVEQRFFDMAFNRQKISALKIEGLNAKSGAITPKPLRVDYVTLKDEEDAQGRAFVDVSGTFGETPFNAEIGVKRDGRPGRRVYEIGRERDFKLDVSDMHIAGRLRNTVLGDWQLENTSVNIGDQKALRGNFDVAFKEQDIEIKGAGKIYPRESDIRPDITITTGSPLKISGKIENEVLILDDLKADAPLLKVVDVLNEVFSKGDEEKASMDYSGLEIQLELDIKQLRDGQIVYGSIQTPLTLQNNVLKAGPLGGKISGGSLEGDVTLDAHEKPAALDTKILIKDFDYAEFQKQFRETADIRGKANLAIDLSARGSDIDALLDDLKGKVSFVGGEGSMRSGLLEVWGGGLLNALIPAFSGEEDLHVNCVVVNADIQNMKARSDAMFVDTKEITLNGEGVYDIKGDYLDMLLEPQAKEIAIGDISSAVIVTGPLGDLEISPNAFAIGKKLGGLLMGAVNPAFYALTLTDLGLSDEHPCKQYVIEQEDLPPPAHKNVPQNTEANESDVPSGRTANE